MSVLGVIGSGGIVILSGGVKGQRQNLHRCLAISVNIPARVIRVKMSVSTQFVTRTTVTNRVSQLRRNALSSQARVAIRVMAGADRIADSRQITV
jgi:hypothetical protein